MDVKYFYDLKELNNFVMNIGKYMYKQGINIIKITNWVFDFHFLMGSTIHIIKIKTDPSAYFIDK